MATLLGLHYSPWTEKARWALDSLRVPYVYVEHTPLVGELALRRLARRWRGVVSVPLLVDGDEIYRDSLAIAEYANAKSEAAPLIDESNRVEVLAWSSNSESMLSAGRARFVRELVSDRVALRESVPQPFQFLGPMATPLAELGARFILKKYASDEFSDEQARREVRQICLTLKTALRGRRYLVGGRFSYADICMATALQVVRPIDGPRLRLGDRTRELWTDTALADEFSGLLAWRDELVADHRP